MSLNATVSAERLHIAFFGCRNAGKSSVVNAVTNQELSVVSDVKGTTTDPVTKAMELLPLGPVVIIDTPGFDDEGMLGEKRVLRTKQVLNRTDIAVLVIDATIGMSEIDKQLIAIFKEKMIPWIVVYNKSDLLKEVPEAKENVIWTSAEHGTNIYELKEMIGRLAPVEDPDHRLLKGLVDPNDVIVLVCPIDESAPKGRLILPQQQAVRDVLDMGGIAIVCREFELTATLQSLAKKPRVVITDSQAFTEVNRDTPADIPLTSFSILMARYKGYLDTALRGVEAIRNLKDGDVILMAEGCTHHRQCYDIGTYKIPTWLRNHTGKKLDIETCSGREFPEDLSPYAMVIHCGGCMLTERDVRYRMKCAEDQNIPFLNYGIIIAEMKGALERSIACLRQRIPGKTDIHI